MTLGEKIKQARKDMNISQSELAKMTGISERSIYTYEQLGTLPRKSSIKKLAEALNLTVPYLMGEEDFVYEAGEMYGTKAKREAASILQQSRSLFAGGELPEEDMVAFMDELQAMYLDAKKKAKKYTPKKYSEE